MSVSMSSEGDFKREIILTILEAYPDLDSLKFFLEVQICVSLEQVSLAGNLKAIVLDLVNWSVSEGRLAELIQSAASDKPVNPRLRKLVERVRAGETLSNANMRVAVGSGVTTSPKGSQAVATVEVSYVGLGSAIQDFLNGLNNRRELFRYLNAYKELHEIMHELSRSRSRIWTTVHARMNDPAQPLADDVVESLEDWIRKGQEWIRETEFPDRPVEWINRMQTSLAILTDSDTGRWQWAVERLESIPPREMSRLNDRLVDNAARLLCEELVDSLDSVLAALVSESKAGSQSELFKRATQFRDHCKQMVQLVDTHNECQQIEDLMGEAAGLHEVTANTLMAWPEIMDRLGRLKARCVGNRRVGNTYTAAEHFAASTVAAEAAGDFATLREHFEDLFHTTDKELLKVTNKIGNSVFSLAQQLEELK